MTEHNYEFHYADPGMFLELYIPTVYEPHIKRTLLNGMQLARVQNYLTNRKNMRRIQGMLANNTELAHYDKARVKRMKRVLKGYSIYQVDGTFSDEKGIEVCAERVSVVRLMFLPELKKRLLEKERFWARRFLRYWTHSPANYEQHLAKEPSHHHDGERQTTKENKQESDLVRRLDTWLNDVDLMVNGYILDSLCCDIKRHKDAGLAEDLEQEIWISSFRTLAVNRIVLRK